LRARTRFRRCRVRHVPFSCFALTDSFSAIPRESCLVFMFCVLGLIFGGTEGVRSRFHVLRARTRFRRCRVRHVPFSCFALTDSFSAIPRESCQVFMFCTRGLIFGGAEGVGSRFHVMCARIHFRRYRGRSDPFSSFALADSFSTVPSASRPIYMFCAPGLILGGTLDVGSSFHVLCSRTPFRRYRGRHVPFSCFAHPDPFSAVPSASCPVFMFCAHGHVFGVNVGVGAHSHVVRFRTHFRRY
jgi:hypothetical protein